MKIQNLYKLTNSQLLKVNGGCQERIIKAVEYCSGGKMYTIIFVNNSEGDIYDFHWQCSCGCGRSEGSLIDAEIFASLHLKQAHGDFTWGKYYTNFMYG